MLFDQWLRIQVTFTNSLVLSYLIYSSYRGRNKQSYSETSIDVDLSEGMITLLLKILVNIQSMSCRKMTL